VKEIKIIMAGLKPCKISQRGIHSD